MSVWVWSLIPIRDANKKKRRLLERIMIRIRKEAFQFS